MKQPRSSFSRSQFRVRWSLLWRRSLVAIVSLLLVFASPVAALTDDQADFFYANGIYYYNPSGVNTNCKVQTTGTNVTIIGDSITNAARTQITDVLPTAEIYAADSKHFGTASDAAAAPGEGNPSGFSIVKYLNSQSSLRSIVVYALGTNDASLSLDTINDIISTIGSSHSIFFITEYSSTEPTKYDNNNALFSSAAQYSNVQVINWAAEAAKDPALYIRDDSYHVHPTTEGAKLFASLIETAIGGGSSLTAGVNGNYTNYAGAQILSAAQISNLEHLIPLYNRAIQDTSGASSRGINWQILATLHYKESRLSYTKNPTGNNQGIFQLKSLVDAGKNYPAGATLTDDDVVAQAKDAIGLIISKMDSAGIDTLSNDDNVKKMFFYYNGAAAAYVQKALDMGFTDTEAHNGEGSVYVMNRFDAIRDPTNEAAVSPLWIGRYTADGEYSEDSTTNSFGAYTVYASMGGATICSGGMVSGGLSYEQATALMKDYLSSNVTCSDWTNNCGYNPTVLGGKANCVTFTQYFISRFTTAGRIGNVGDGKQVVGNLTGTDVLDPLTGTMIYHNYDYSDKGFVYGGFEPHVYAVFSRTYGSGAGHTGIVLGIDEANDVIYIGNASYTDGQVSAQRNDGGAYHNEKALASVKQKLSDFVNKGYWYAYMDNILNTNAIAEAVGNGMGL